MAVNDRVVIREGMPEFRGQTGVVVAKEGRQWRIRLDEPVDVPFVGLVRDDLWDTGTFKKVR